MDGKVVDCSLPNTVLTYLELKLYWRILLSQSPDVHWKIRLKG